MVACQQRQQSRADEPSLSVNLSAQPESHAGSVSLSEFRRLGIARLAMAGCILAA
jgi:hypothetical protein